MIQPETFYEDNEHPGTSSKHRMWKHIQRETRTPGGSVFFIADGRSFIYGIAAAVILYFTSVGAYTTIMRSLENAKPEILRLDEAYQSAIEDFEKIVPQVAYSSATSDRERNYLEVRKEQLQKIDAAITALRKEIGGGDVSPLARKQLRQLYVLKLTVLQELVDKGEIEL
ncbi:MAG: hypothetical protein EPO24_14830 [Bacteroidetes bacterium]|nr:MAG: hypothetical protein EPO24_14830 [Bacteroidota bacterium]